MMIVLALGLNVMHAQEFLHVPVNQSSASLICPGSSRLVIPFRTGPGVTHVNRIIFPRVVRPAFGGWDSPGVYCGITPDLERDLKEDVHQFRYNKPVSGGAEGNVVFDRPFWKAVATFDQPGGAGLAANTNYFLVLDFSADVLAGLHGGWCLPAGSPSQAMGVYTLGSSPPGSVPWVVIEGVIHRPPPEQPQSAFSQGSGPVVSGVAWTQRGEGTSWVGSESSATIAVSGTVPYGGNGYPDSPPAWRGLEATLMGPGTLNYAPIISNQGEEGIKG